MLRLIARRAIGLVIILFFVLTNASGPFDRERKLPEHIEKQLLTKYKLDGPLPDQYLNYLKDARRSAVVDHIPKPLGGSVNEILADALPVSATLGGIAFCVATLGVCSSARWLRPSANMDRPIGDVIGPRGDFPPLFHHRSAAGDYFPYPSCRRLGHCQEPDSTRYNPSKRLTPLTSRA
jgi:hypothetical protein